MLYVIDCEKIISIRGHVEITMGKVVVMVVHTWSRWVVMSNGDQSTWGTIEKVGECMPKTVKGRSR